MLIVAKHTTDPNPTCHMPHLRERRPEFKSLEAGLGPLYSSKYEMNISQNECLIKSDTSCSLPNLSSHRFSDYFTIGKIIYSNDCSLKETEVLSSSNVAIDNTSSVINNAIYMDNSQDGLALNTCKIKDNLSLSRSCDSINVGEHGKTPHQCKDKIDTYFTEIEKPSDDTHYCTLNEDYEFDVEKDDDVTLLKGSPQSSPNKTGTLDSGICSLGKADSFGKTDVSSLSSVSSFGTGNEPSIVVNGVYDENELDTESYVQPNAEDDHMSDGFDRLGESGAKAKKKTFGSFLTRGLFSWKCKGDTSSNSPGWGLFKRTVVSGVETTPNYAAPSVPVTEAAEVASIASAQSEDSTTSDQVLRTGTLPMLDDGKSVKKTDIEVLSTTALILQQRPSGLPEKDPEEESRHRQLHEQMIQAAKKKEVREAKQRRKQLQQQLKHEECIAAAAKTWSSEILPHWHTMSTTPRARELWWRGIPPSVRGRVWQKAFRNDLNLTRDLYHICLNRAKERLKLIEDWCGDTDSICSHMSGFSDHLASREASVELIKLDVSRTFPQLCIFQQGGPYHELLQGLLGAYVCYRPDVGYVQGMSFIAAVLLLNMEAPEAFICFANLLNQPCQIAFFRLDEPLIKAYFDTYEELLEENLPALQQHFRSNHVTPDLYIIDWMFTLYAKSLPLDVASRVWDVFARDGEEFLFRTALGILRLYEDILLKMDFIHLAQFLTRLPEQLGSEQLFAQIERTRMCIDTRKFSDLLAAHRDAQRSTEVNAQQAYG